MTFFLDKFLDKFSNNMAIDLGTANTLIYINKKGVVLNEPSVVSINKERNQILAVGADAKRMIGRTPPHIAAIRPLRDGVIADFEITEIMLKHFIKKVANRWALFRPKIVIAVPSGITQVEKMAVIEAAEKAGARGVFLIEEPLAAAIGADLPVTTPECSMVVDIGGGTTEVAAISLSGIVYSHSLRMAGDKMDEAIALYIRNRYNLLIGAETAEKVKMTIGNAYPDEHHMDIKGRDPVSGVPKILSIGAAEICESISEEIKAIVERVKMVLERTPPELAGDILDNGIVLTGGVANLKNLDKLIQEKTGVQVTRAENPLLTVVLGSGKTLDDPELLQKVMIPNMSVRSHDMGFSGVYSRP